MGEGGSLFFGGKGGDLVGDGGRISVVGGEGGLSRAREGVPMCEVGSYLWEQFGASLR